MNQTDAYHMCRLAFICGEEHVPWYMMVHAIRQSLGIADKYNFSADDARTYPQLYEFMREASKYDKGTI